MCIVFLFSLRLFTRYRWLYGLIFYLIIELFLSSEVLSMEKEPIIDKLTIDDLAKFFDDLETKLEDFRVVSTEAIIEKYGDLNRVVEYKGRCVDFLAYKGRLENIKMWIRKGNSTTYIGEYNVNRADYKAIIFSVIDKVGQGLCRCNYCGKWVPDNKDTVNKCPPASVSCMNPDCLKAQAKEFYDILPTLD